MMPKSKLSRDQWLALVAEYAQSSSNVAEFCASKDVSTQSFYQWKRKAEGRWPSAKAEPPDVNDTSGKLPTFVPLRLAGSLERVEVELPGGVFVRVPAKNESTLRQVLQIVVDLQARAGR
jgi:transposase-like protein